MPASVTEQTGNVLTRLGQPGVLVLHQCNCITPTVRFLAADIFARVPTAHVHTRRTQGRRLCDTPGTVDVVDGVVNLFGQRCPGPPSAQETAAERRVWFQQALDALTPLLPPHTMLVIPHRIGCGVARGDWTVYREMLIAWAATLPDGIRIEILQQPTP